MAGQVLRNLPFLRELPSAFLDSLLGRGTMLKFDRGQVPPQTAAVWCALCIDPLLLVVKVSAVGARCAPGRRTKALKREHSLPSVSTVAGVRAPAASAVWQHYSALAVTCTKPFLSHL